MSFEPTSSAVDPSSLGGLLRADFDGQDVWSESDLGEIFTHMWRTPVADVIGVSAMPADLDRRTFGEVLDGTSIDSLKEIKRYAKSVGAAKPASAPLPREVARALYIASILAARVAGESITSMSEHDQARAARWLKGRPWIPPIAKALFEKF